MPELQWWFNSVVTKIWEWTGTQKFVSLELMTKCRFQVGFGAVSLGRGTNEQSAGDVDLVWALLVNPRNVYDNISAPFVVCMRFPLPKH